MQTISRGSWPLRLLKISLVLAGLGLVALLALTAFFSTQLPDTSSLSNYQPKQPLRVLTADGVEVAGFGTERRVYKPIDQIPQLMKDSLLAVEDARFYEHGGLDPIGVARAIVANLTGGRTQGASTITQQVARTFFLSRSRTLERKIKEALLAFKIESQLSKDQILDRVWKYDFGGDGRIVESYVYYLRRKIDKTDPPLIHTVRGVGYALRMPRADE